VVLDLAGLTVDYIEIAQQPNPIRDLVLTAVLID
jgi:hypothetical protein